MIPGKIDFTEENKKRDLNMQTPYWELSMNKGIFFFDFILSI
jgi:hypothetical protein